MACYVCSYMWAAKPAARHRGGAARQPRRALHTAATPRQHLATPPAFAFPPSVSPPQRPPIPGGPYLAGLRVLAMSDARGFQDETPFDTLSDPLREARCLEVLRINRCQGLQLGIEGEAGRKGGGRG